MQSSHPSDPLRRPRGILFDLGNTILHEEVFDAEAGTRHVLGLAHDPREISVDEVVRLVAELDQDLRERREASWFEISPYAIQRLVYEPNKISFDRSFHEIELEFFRAATRFHLTEGIVELLENLRARDIPLGIVSNAAFTSDTLAWLVAHFGIDGYFAFVMSSGDYIVRKPHPAIFTTAARRLGTGNEETWFVGDQPHYDVAGARSAGMTSILYRPHAVPSGTPVADIEIGAWSELADLIERLDRPD